MHESMNYIHYKLKDGIYYIPNILSSRYFFTKSGLIYKRSREPDPNIEPCAFDFRLLFNNNDTYLEYIKDNFNAVEAKPVPTARSEEGTYCFYLCEYSGRWICDN